MGKVFYILEHSDEDYKQYQMCEIMEVIKVLQPTSFNTDEWTNPSLCHHAMITLNICFSYKTSTAK